MTIRNFFLLITLSIFMVSTKAMSDQCVTGSNFFLPAGESYTAYDNPYPTYNDEVIVTVTLHDGGPLRIEDGDGFELVTLSGRTTYGDDEWYEYLDTLVVICEGDDCNISWNICRQSPEFTIAEPPTPPTTRIDDLATDEDDDEAIFRLGYTLNPQETHDLGWTRDPSRLDCPDGTVLMSYEVPVLRR